MHKSAEAIAGHLLDPRCFTLRFRHQANELAHDMAKMTEASGPQAASLPLDDLHHGVLGEAKIAADRAIREPLLVLRMHLLQTKHGDNY